MRGALYVVRDYIGKNNVMVRAHVPQELLWEGNLFYFKAFTES